jgi:PTS system nitrogen regulatory IIA component
VSLADFIVSTAILECADSAGKIDVVQQLLHRLAADGHLDPGRVPLVFDGVMRRESLGSTGIGRGIAIPHTKHPGVPRRLGILGICRPPVDFDSVDGEPADLIFLILAPPDLPGYQSMRVPREMEELPRRLRSDKFCNQLRHSTTEVELREILSQSELADW